MFVIEDEDHAEHHGRFDTLEAALEELRRRARIPWDQSPNKAPCMSWKTCGRRYVIIEYDGSSEWTRELRRVEALEISKAGVRWATGLEHGPARP